MKFTYTYLKYEWRQSDATYVLVDYAGFYDQRDVAACKKGREQAAQAAQLQAQAAQQQAQVAAASQASGVQAQQAAQALAEKQFAASQQVQSQQLALAQKEEAQAEAQQAAKTGLINSNLSYMNGLQPELDQLKSPYGQLTPAAQAQYASDIGNIDSVYKNAQQSGLQQLQYRGMNGAPQGSQVSLINTNNNARAAAQTDSYRQGLSNTANQNLEALQGEMNLGNMKNSLVNAYNPEGDYSLVNTSLNGAGGLTGGMQGAASTTLGGFGAQEQGLSGATGALNGSTNAANGELNAANTLNSMGSTFGNILGGIGSLATSAIPGSSLIGRGFAALAPKPAPITSGVGLFG
jgi:hypothetical protein